MTLPHFELHRPETIEEALELLGEHGDDAVAMQGGTELLLLLKLGLADYGHIVDLKRVPELRALDASNGRLRIGAGVTHLELERSAMVREGWPALVRMEQMVANVRVRAAGTIGGNLAFSDPHSDPATFLLATDATVLLRGRSGARELAIRDFLLGPYDTALEAGELLVSVGIPAAAQGAQIVHSKLAFHERPAATVTCLVRVAEGGVAEARLAVGSVGPVPVRAVESERLLSGLDALAPDPSALERATEAAAEAAQPIADSNGSVDYKLALVATLARRAFLAACSNQGP
jgi:aerobic carbon-monoxide dehydrogenase medium subunit